MTTPAIDLIEKPYPYSDPFLSLPEEQFIEMLMKSWLDYFTLASGMESVEVLPAYPDDTEKMRIPSLVMTRVGEDHWKLGRVGGFYGVISGETSASLSEVRGYRYDAMYQFDLYTRTIKDQAKYEAIIANRLRRRTDITTFDAIGISEVPVNDYSTNVSGEVTNLRAKYRLYEDVESVRVSNPFDQQVHQTTFRVSFWCDVLRTEEAIRIQKITVSGTKSY